MENEQFRSLCLSCYRPTKACFCSFITPFDTHSEFRILMHPKEAKQGHIGTGRMTNYALKKSKIIVGENFDQNPHVQEILHSNDYLPMILYPGSNAINLSTTKLEPSLLKNKIPLIFIIDGSWPCAKSMMRDSLCLHQLQKISFDTNIESKFSIKYQPAKFCLSTIESCYQLLSSLEAQGLENTGEKKDCLMRALGELVNFHLKCASDPTLKRYDRKGGSYKLPGARVNAKKWDGRKICFEEKILELSCILYYIAAMANIKAKEITNLKDWNTKELRKLRMTIKNRIAALEKPSPKELGETHPLYNLEISECQTLLDKVIRAEKGLKK